MKEKVYEYPMIEITGPEADIRAFVEREIEYRIVREEFYYQFIRAFYINEELTELLNYYCKICADPEKENAIENRIFKQNLEGNFEAQNKYSGYFGIKLNPYVHSHYDDIHILNWEPNRITIAIDCYENYMSEVWRNYLINEYENINFTFGTTILNEEMRTMKRNSVIYYYENEFDGSYEDEELE